jgi:hypothetical protein
VQPLTRVGAEIPRSTSVSAAAERQRMSAQGHSLLRPARPASAMRAPAPARQRQAPPQQRAVPVGPGGPRLELPRSNLLRPSGTSAAVYQAY